MRRSIKVVKLDIVSNTQIFVNLKAIRTNVTQNFKTIIYFLKNLLIKVLTQFFFFLIINQSVRLQCKYLSYRTSTILNKRFWNTNYTKLINNHELTIYSRKEGILFYKEFSFHLGLSRDFFEKTEILPRTEFFHPWHHHKLTTLITA